MSKQHKIPAEMRTDVGKGASRRLRRAGRVPAVVYGGDREPANITIDHDFLLHAAREEAFHVSILELSVEDKTLQVILRDLQRHPYKPLLTHADFQRISADQTLRISLPIHFINEAISPAGREPGVVISHQVVEVEVEALPKDLPEYLEVDLAEFEPGDSVMLSEIPLPEGVMIPALKYGDEDADYSIVNAIYIREGQGTGELAAEADAALAEAADVATIDEAEEAEAEAEVEGEEGEEGESEEAKAEGEEAGHEQGEGKARKED